jgi:hypothetical protein
MSLLSFFLTVDFILFYFILFFADFSVLPLCFLFSISPQSLVRSWENKNSASCSLLLLLLFSLIRNWVWIHMSGGWFARGVGELFAKEKKEELSCCFLMEA